MKNVLLSFWDKLRDFFGLRKNTTYVKDYLNRANMRSGIFMAAVIILLELWLVIRQTQKYVISAIIDGTPVFQAIFQNLWTYFLLMSLGIAMLVYCLQYVNVRNTKAKLITCTVFAGISLILCCFLPFEFIYKSIKFNSTINTYRAIFKLIFYGSIVAFNVSVIIAGIYQYRGGQRQAITSVLVISLFALVCLAFGWMISYGDFTSSKVFYYDNGDPVILEDGAGSYAYEHKQIICFLMMAIYVGCLLIWKPYASIGILGAVFLGFYLVLDQLANVGGRRLPEGDKVNYLTFFISLTMICISLYNQRISEAKKDEELELLATRDVLTDLWAFEYFITLVNQKIKDENIKDNEYAYLFFNIANFKIYNDQRGFEEGNKFLKTFGQILEEEFPNDLVTRQSDDHFVVFTKKVDFKDVIASVDKKTEQQDLDIKPGVKVGIYYAISSEDPHFCVEKARYACTILEKRGGLDLIQDYDHFMQDAYYKAQYVVNHIDEAIEKGYIKAYYQPVVFSKGRKICGAEALARWIDPKYGFLSPAAFIPVLENSQLIYKLDLAMLRLICKQMRENLDNNEPVIPVSINFSRIDFKVVDAVSIIESTMEEYKIPRDYLHVEITESALMNDEDLLKTSIDRLHELGYAVWLDDFGSGYSSFNVLKDYAFDMLKLDMEFLVGFDTNEKSKILIQSVIDMANKVGINTLSEGVETKEEADFLEEIGCERLQGYLFSKPVPYEELKSMIDKGTLKLDKELLKKHK